MHPRLETFLVKSTFFMTRFSSSFRETRECCFHLTIPTRICYRHIHEETILKVGSFPLKNIPFFCTQHVKMVKITKTRKSRKGTFFVLHTALVIKRLSCSTPFWVSYVTNIRVDYAGNTVRSRIAASSIAAALPSF